MASSSDNLTALVQQRTQLIRQFADDLLAIDLEIATKQRENVTASASSMLAGPYASLEERVKALEART